ncbi:MAG: hypothetical protein CMF99_08460 [Candidatus Marinimicrobia bacterium]|nr:hypothetical protein [Candidatus Neomarinimicrobiota bacterium]
MVLFLWRCASAPSPPPLPPPEPVVKKLESPTVIPPSPPRGLKVQSVIYDRYKMVIEWEKSADVEFGSYRLLQSIGGGKDSDTILVTRDINQTNFVLEKFDPTKENWFWIDVMNTTRLHTSGERKSNTLEVEAPKSSSLQTMEGRYDLKIQWTKNKDEDFEKYTIYRSSVADMKNKEKVKDVLSREDTIQVLSLDSVYFYQVVTQDYWGLKSYSNVIKGDYQVKIWDEEYSIVQTRKIDLTNKKLFGTIPPEFGKLLNLEILLLQSNFLTGDIPEELWGLRKLRVLNISKNQFSGKIPADIHKANAIQEIWFANNDFDGSLPHQIFTLKNLTHLNLSSNRFSGNISESVSNLENLRYLNLFDNNFMGSIPSEIGELKNLKFLSLGKNNLTGSIPPEIAGADKLESIALFENQLIGKIPMEVVTLKNLVYLGLFDNQLGGNISNQIFENSNFSYLRLNNNLLEQVNYDSLCQSGYNWGNSIYFDVSDNDFKEELPSCFSERVFYEIYSSFKFRK